MVFWTKRVTNPLNFVFRLSNNALERRVQSEGIFAGFTEIYRPEDHFRWFAIISYAKVRDLKALAPGDCMWYKASKA